MCGLRERMALKRAVLVGRLKDAVGRAGPFRLFLLGLAIGVGIGVLGGRIAERLRLLDYVAIEEIILERERPPVSRLRGRPGPLRPGAPGWM